MKIVNLRAFRADKKAIVRKELSSGSPTIVVTGEKGILVCAEKIAKVHSTILLAGTGQSFAPMAQWFRNKINQLILEWGPNVPRACREIELLPLLFEPNLDASSEFVYADMLVIEIEETEEKDFIARVDFLGNTVDYSGSNLVVVSYDHDLDIDEDKHEDDSKSEEDREKEKWQKKIDELVSMGIGDRDMFDQIKSGSVEAFDAFVESLVNNYPDRMGFLNRERLAQKQFFWIYEE